jgi:hypothetical protein
VTRPLQVFFCEHGHLTIATDSHRCHKVRVRDPVSGNKTCWASQHNAGEEGRAAYILGGDEAVLHLLREKGLL